MSRDRTTDYDIVRRSTTFWVITVWYIIRFSSTFSSVHNYLKMSQKFGNSKGKDNNKWSQPTPVVEEEPEEHDVMQR